MPITPVKGVNVLLNPSMLSASSWGAQNFTAATGENLSADIYSNWHDNYAEFAHVVDGGKNALLLEEHTNYGSAFASGCVEFANAADFLTKAGQEWRVKFTWKRETTENNRKRVRAIFKGATTGGHLTLVGPWGMGRKYDWTFTFPKWWYDQVQWGSAATGWTHSLESMFLIGLTPWNAGPQYPDYNITDPHTDPDFDDFDFQITLFATDTHWTGGYTNPADTAPAPDPGDPPPVAPVDLPEDDPTPTPATGSYPENLCGVFDREALVDEDGIYIGNPGLGDGPGGPYGWVSCTSYCENIHGLLRSFEFTPCPCDIGGGLRLPAAPIPFSFGVQHLSSVVDTSGPPGLEGMLAMQLDSTGAGGGLATWMGTQVYDGSDWVYGGLGGDTGWRPAFGELWVFQCWTKAIPDDDGFVMNGGSHIGFHGTLPGLSDTVLVPGEPINDTWTFFQGIFAWPYHGTAPGDASWGIPSINIGGDELVRSEDYTQSFFGHDFTLNGFVPKGRMLIKCPHLYPYVAQELHVWANDFAGRDV